MINGIKELEEVEKENQELKDLIKELKSKTDDLEYTLEEQKSKITDLQEELDFLYDDNFEMVKNNFEGLVEYLDDNHLLTEELKNIIELFMKFYIEA